MNEDADEVDFVAVVTEELAADGSLPEAVKEAIRERAKILRVRRKRPWGVE